MKPFLEPANKHKKVRMSAAALSTTGIKALKRILYCVMGTTTVLEDVDNKEKLRSNSLQQLHRMQGRSWTAPRDQAGRPG